MNYRPRGAGKTTAASFPRMYIDEASAGVIRFVDGDAMTGILDGRHAREIVARCNAHEQLVEAATRALKYLTCDSTPLSDADIIEPLRTALAASPVTKVSGGST